MRGTQKSPFDFASGDVCDSAKQQAESELFLFFSTADAVDGGQDRAQLICPEPGREVGQVVALAEQNAIDLVPAPCLAAHLYKQTIRGIASEGETEAL